MKRHYFFIFFCLLIFSFTNEKAFAQCPVTITPTPTSVCVGATTTLTASGATTYTWSSNAGGVITAAVAVTPLSNTIYTVTATTGTCVATQTVAIMVISLPSLTVVASPTSVCPGASSTLTASGGTTYTWSANAGGGNATTATVTPPVFTTYTLTGSNGTCTNTAVVAVAVSPLPTVSIIANPQSVCVGGASTLTATGASSYTWSANAGSATTATTVVNPGATTVYTVTGANSSGCIATQTVSVNIVPFLSVFIASSPATVCSGGTSTLTASGASSYTWSANAGGVSTATTVVNPTAGTIYTVTTSSGACVATQTVNIPIISSLSVSIIPNPSTICAGQTSTLTANGGGSYSWSVNAGGGNAQSAVVTPFVSTIYAVTATNGTCTATQTVAITVNPAPTISIVATPTSVCAAGTSTLTASGATSYTWSANAGGVNAPTTAVTPAATTVYTVTGSNGTCTSTQTITINVVPFLTISVTANPLSVCAAGTSTLTASGANTYTWSANAGSGNAQTTIVNPTVNTSYTVTASNGTCVASQAINVSINPSLTVSITPNAPNVCFGQTYTLTANGASSYTWSANAGGVSTQTVAVTPISNTVYTVMATSGSCTATETVLVTVINNSITISPPVGTTTLYCTGVPYQFGAIDTTSSGFSVQYYQWYSSPSAGVSIANSSCGTCNGPTITFANTGTYTLTVLVNLTSGCLDSAKYVLSVIQTPTISTIPFAPSVCQGGPLGTMLYVTGAGAAGTYVWSPMINIATTYAAGDSVLINPSNAGVYTYTVVGTNAAGCPSQPVTIMATVFPPPTFTAVATNDSICSYLNTSVHMVPSSSLTSVGATYTWTSGPNANLGTPFAQTSAVSPIYSGNVDTTFTYYCNVDIPGCPAYPTYTTYVVVVPTPTVHVVSDTMYNCNKMGDSLKVTSNPSYGVHFGWWPHYNISDTAGSGVFVHPLVQTTYYVTPSITVGSNICIGKRDSVKVLIGDTTNAFISVQYDIVCNGMVDTLYANPPRTQLNSTYQYYWTIPSISSGTTTVTGDTLIITPNALGIYTLTVIGTCVNRQTTQAFIAVNNCVTPTPSYSVTADTICRRHCATFTDLTQSYTVRPLFYRWVFTVLPPQISISCLGQGCIIHQDTVWYSAGDSAAIPKIKVCYYQNSALNMNGSFPVIETVSHSPTYGLMTSTITGSMTVYDGPLANAGHSQTVNLGDHAQLSGSLSSGTLAGIAGYSWSPPTALSCTACVNTTATPSVTTQYVLTIIDKNGCIDTSNVTVFVDLFCFDPFIPSAFSPNGDKENDMLYVRSNCLTNFTFKVFDRWGEKVFETNDLTFGWDGHFRGEPMNAAVFVYTLEGYLSNGKEVKQKGNITLVK